MSELLELEKLNDMKVKGLITEKEFSQKRKELMKKPSTVKKILKWVFIAWVVIAFFAALSEMGKKEDGSPVSSGSGSESAQAAVESKGANKKAEKSFRVGETVKTKDFEVTVISTQKRDNVGEDFMASSASEGAVYIAVRWKVKNISGKPISAFRQPLFNLLDKNGTKYDSDIGASGAYATELNLDQKIMSDLNPGITVNGAEIFEVARDQFDEKSWKIKISADQAYMVNMK